MILLFCFLLFTIDATAAAPVRHLIPVRQNENQPPHLSDNIWDSVLYFRYKPWNEDMLTDDENKKKYSGMLAKYPPVWDLFDWILYDGSRGDKAPGIFVKKDPYPRYILCEPQHLVYTVDQVLRIGAGVLNHDLTIVVAGDDGVASTGLHEVSTFLTDANFGDHMTPETIFDIFTTVFWEAKDIYEPRIKTMPMGINPAYVLRNGLDNVNAATVGQPTIVKKTLVAAAWGAVWSHLDTVLDSRKSLTAYLDSPTTDWVNRTMWEPEEYYRKLSECFFLIAPSGNGIQTPKLFEAWLVHTIPVSLYNPAFVDLQNMGFPILLVHKWDDLSRNLLEYELGTRFAKVNWEKIVKKITTSFVTELLTGQEPVGR